MPLRILLGLCAVVLAAVVVGGRPASDACLLSLLIGLGLLLDLLLAPEQPSPGGVCGTGAPQLRRADLVVACGSIGLAIAAAFRVWADPEGRLGLAWLLHLGALAGGVWVLARWRAFRGLLGARPGPLELAAVVLILAAGGYLRLRGLGDLPSGVWFDEAQNILEARRILDEPGHWPVYVRGLSQMPALPFYWFAAFLGLLESPVVALRTATAVVGLLAVAATWLLGRELFGPWTGVAAAGLLAFSRWHVLFSRFGMAMVFTTLVVPVAALLVHRAVRLRRPALGLASGMVASLGLQTYYALLAAPAVLLVPVLLELRSRWRNAVAVGLAFGVGLLVAASPFLAFALRRPEAVVERIRTVSSVGTASPSEGVARPQVGLWERVAGDKTTFVAHLRMFHRLGDGNGRHNLPGEPMLHPLVGALFGAGLVLLVNRGGAARLGLLFAWMLLFLSAGALSLDFEAPQGARTLGLLPAVAVTAAWPLGMLCAEGARRSKTWRLTMAGALGAALLVLAASARRDLFERFAADPAAWSAFSPAECEVGREMRKRGDAWQHWIVPEFRDTPSQTLLAGPGATSRLFEGDASLPLGPTGIQGAVLYLKGGDDRLLARLRRLYPESTARALRPVDAGGRDTGPPVLWVVEVPERNLDRLARWIVERTDGHRTETLGELSSSVLDRPLAPESPSSAAPVVRGTLRAARSGPHRIRLRGPGRPRLLIDDAALEHARSETGQEIELAAGLHRILWYPGGLAPEAQSRLEMQLPGEAAFRPLGAGELFRPEAFQGGLLGEYRSESQTGVAGRLVRIDPAIDFYFHLLPVPRPFVAAWRGRLMIARPGEYRFSTLAVDEASLWLDGRKMLEHGRGESPWVPVSLAAGSHPIEVRFGNRSDYAEMRLRWIEPGGEPAVVPEEALLPAAPTELLQGHSP